MTIGSSSKSPDGTIVNVSSRELTPMELNLLSKGLNFAPSPSHVPMTELIAATEYGIKQLPEGEANLVRCDVYRTLKKAKPPRPNIGRAEKDALSRLKGDDSIIILSADKGRSTVVMDKDEYITKMHDLLTEGETYQVQAKDPTSKLEKAIGDAIKELEEGNKLAKDQAANLKPKNSLSPRIYGLPKIHKDDMPLRPIVSSI